MGQVKYRIDALDGLSLRLNSDKTLAARWSTESRRMNSHVNNKKKKEWERIQ